jgi:anaerobic ribonucleoside-triphosphate reductase activating protein
MYLRIFNIIKNTKVEGPGNRYCIWVQGCSRHCKGCQAVHTWSHEKGELYDVEDIINDIFNNIAPSPQPSPDGRESKPIEGVTFLGGEPFEQAEALGVIAERVQEKGLSVVCFTGGKYEVLKENPVNTKLLDNTDLLIDGEFIQELTDYSRPWCGSSNQRYHFLTDRYNVEIFTKYKNKVEVNISKNGQIFMNGMGNFDEILQKIDLQALKK